MKTITISDETYNAIKNHLSAEETIDLSALDEMVGKAYFFRTVTYHFTGRVKRFLGNIIVLEDAAWIADSGRFMQAIKEGGLSEVEPVGTCLLNLSTVVDIFPWVHPLPMKQI